MTSMANLLEQLDEALALVPEKIPWAERTGNCVVWAEPDDAGWSPSRFPQVQDLFEHCREIRMADVGTGWFVHRRRAAPDDAPDVPRHVDGLGSCYALGSDGGGGWFVVAGDGEVVALPPGLLRDGRYEQPAGPQARLIARSVVDFLELLLGHATSTAHGTG